MRSSITFRVFLAAGVAAAALSSLAATPAPASAEPVTPQAANANAAFLPYPSTPPPPTPMKVCVVDTGVDLTTDAAPAVVERYSEFGGTVGDTGGGGIAKHGTFVAGVIASQLDGQGSVGIWPRAQIVSVRVFESQETGTTVAWYLHALDLCRRKGAKVVNLSLSGLETATGPELAELENKIANMRDFQNVNVVAAAGNTGGEIGFPARFTSSLAVGASDVSGSLCEFSSRGPELDISALGCGVVLSLPEAALGVGNGTSYSTPVVSGILGALRAYRPDLGPAEAEAILTSSARSTGAGRVLDAAAAFRRAGLDNIVTAPLPPVATATAVSPTTSTNTPSVVSEVAAPAPADSLAELGVKKPRVRSSGFRRGVLTVVVSGVPGFGRAIFTVDNHRFVRSSGRLRVTLQRPPRRVSVLIEVPGSGRTAAVKVAVKVARKRRAR